MHLKDLVTSIAFGLSTSIIMAIIGMSFGLDGIEYYGEIHTKLLNKIIHFIFMPFTMYGILLYLPQLLFYNKVLLINRFKDMLYIAYITHYLTINITGGILTGIYTFPSLYYSVKHCDIKGYKNILNGFIISFVALVIQEIFGHYISGDEPSRIEAIPNAIVYAPYFAVNNLI